MRRHEVPSLPTALALLLSSGVALADETARPELRATAGEPPAEVLVTGTRIRRSDPTTAAPVRVITRDQIAASGKASLGDFLQTLPEQGNAINTGVNSGGDGSTRVNLRGIGVSRTLVLVNGRRWVPGGTGADGSVDLSSIPSAAVERIEILKDGASAVYGSDAISGVVNIITRRTGEETDASFYTGASGHGDGTTFDVNLTTGTGGERGNILFSAGYYNQSKVMAGDRTFSKIPWFYDAGAGRYSSGSGTIPAGRTLAGGGAGPGNALWNDLVAGDPAGSFLWTNEPAGVGTGYEGTDVLCGPNAAGTTQCFRSYQGAGLREAGDVGDGYNTAAESDLVTPQQRIQLFSTGDLKLGNVGRAYVEAAYANRRSSQGSSPEALVSDGEGIAVSRSNVYNPFDKDVYVRRRMTELGGREARQDVDVFRVVGGVDGTAPGSFGPLAGWSWDAALSWGRTSSVETKKNYLYVPALAAALGPSMIVNGRPTCVSTPGDPSSAIAGCVPLDLFGGPGSITPDQVAGLAFTGKSHGSDELRSLQANASGSLFRLASDRPVALAVGVEHREVSGSFEDDPTVAQGLTTLPRRPDTKGSYDVNELYAELSIPIVSGIQDLEATAAIRWFDYSTFGSDATYALGGRWRVLPGLTVRATYSTAFRAPTIGELYTGPANAFVLAKDPCRGPAAGGPAVGPACLQQGVPAFGSGDVSSLQRSIVGGNPGLGPETATVQTTGLVIEPPSVTNLSFSVDFYEIDVRETVGSYGANVLLAGCYNGTHPEYCSRIIRNPTTSFIDAIVDVNANVGKLSTSGIDFAARYALSARGLGRFGFALAATWLQKVDQTLADGSIVKGRNTFDLNTLNSSGGAGGTFPEWKLNAGVTWGLGGLGAGISTRFLGSFHECGDSSGDFSGSGLCYVDATYRRQVSSYHTEDAFVSYGFGSAIGKTSVMLGVQNLLDRDPALIYNGLAASTDQYNYGQMGRFFYFRLAQSY